MCFAGMPSHKTGRVKKKKRCVMKKLVLKGLMVSDTAPLPRAHPSPILRPVIHMTELNLTSNAGPCGSAFISAASSQRRCDHRRLFSGPHTLPRNRCETVLSALGQQQQQQQCCWDTCLQEFIGLDGSLHRKEINTWQSVLYGYITVLKDVVQEWIRRY